MREAWIVLLASIVFLGGSVGAESRPGAVAAEQMAREFAQAAQPVQWPIEAAVIETMTTGQYTYVKVNSGSGEIWAAGPKTSVDVGDTVVLPSGFSMANFHSNSLDRTFDLIYLLSVIHVKPDNE